MWNFIITYGSSTAIVNQKTERWKWRNSETSSTQNCKRQIISRVTWTHLTITFTIVNLLSKHSWIHSKITCLVNKLLQYHSTFKRLYVQFSHRKLLVQTTSNIIFLLLAGSLFEFGVFFYKCLKNVNNIHTRTRKEKKNLIGISNQSCERNDWFFSVSLPVLCFFFVEKN